MKLLLLVALIAPIALAQQSGWVIVPGQGVGTVRRTSTKAALLRQLGKDAMWVPSIEGDEGPEGPAFLIYNNDDARRLAVVWDTEKDRPMMIYICQGNTKSVCKWRTGSGIGEGTTLQELHQKNGQPFLMAEAGTDLGGNLMFKQGRLHTELDRKGGLLWLTLDINSTRLTKEEERMLEVPGGFVPSNNPILWKLNPKVDRMRFIFDHGTTGE